MQDPHYGLCANLMQHLTSYLKELLKIYSQKKRSTGLYSETPRDPRKYDKEFLKNSKHWDKPAMKMYPLK